MLTDDKTRGLGGACDVDSLEGGGLSRGVQGQDLDLGGVGGEDVHEAKQRGQSKADSKHRGDNALILSDGGDIVVNGGGPIALGVLSDNGGLQVGVDVDLRDLRGSNIGDVEVAGLGAEARPAGRALPVDGEPRGLASGNTIGGISGEIDNVNAETGIGGENRVLAADNGHGERQETTLGGLDGFEVLGKRAIGGDVPDGEDSGGGRDTLDRRDELRVVFVEDNMADGASGAVRRAVKEDQYALQSAINARTWSG